MSDRTEDERRVAEEPIAVLAELRRMGLQRPTYNLASPHGHMPLPSTEEKR